MKKNNKKHYELTILNPHVDDFYCAPVSFFFLKRKALRKYAYILDRATTSFSKLNILIDCRLSSLIPHQFFIKLPFLVRKFLLIFEIYLWKKLNKIDSHIHMHWSSKSISCKKYIYLTSYKNALGDLSKEKTDLHDFDIKIINMSHYFISTAEKARNIKLLKNVILTSEVDLNVSKYFCFHFGKKYKFIVLPFEVNPNFYKFNNFSKREKSCAASGTFHNLKREISNYLYQDFLDFFKTDTYHPIRKKIYYLQALLAGSIVSRISRYRSESFYKDKFIFVSFLKFFDVSQKSYFRFDMNKFYNSHLFAVSGEELSGCPTIGSFEAMASGAAVFLSKAYSYRPLGLRAGVHYIAYDGSLADLISKIRLFKNKKPIVQDISNNAVNFIKTHCSRSALNLSFYKQLTS
jgi:hypothetical protein